MKYLKALLTVSALGALALGFVGVATMLSALHDGNLPFLMTGIIVLALGLAHALQTVGLLETNDHKPVKVNEEELAEAEEKVDD